MIKFTSPEAGEIQVIKTRDILIAQANVHFQVEKDV